MDSSFPRFCASFASRLQRKGIKSSVVIKTLVWQRLFSSDISKEERISEQFQESKKCVFKGMGCQFKLMMSFEGESHLSWCRILSSFTWYLSIFDGLHHKINRGRFLFWFVIRDLERANPTSRKRNTLCTRSGRFRSEFRQKFCFTRCP